MKLLPLTPHEAETVAAEVEYALKTNGELPFTIATVVEGDQRLILFLTGKAA